MGKEDKSLKNYFEDPRRFADAWNAVVYKESIWGEPDGRPWVNYFTARVLSNRQKKKTKTRRRIKK